MDNEVTERQAKERLRTRWTPPLDKIFADLVVEQIQLGNRPNNIFDKKTWGYIRDEFNNQTTLNFNNNQLRKHLDVLRARYNQINSALVQNDIIMEDSCSGFDLLEGIEVIFFPTCFYMSILSSMLFKFSLLLIWHQIPSPFGLFR